MYCKKCGKEFRDGAKFCPSCGESAVRFAAPVKKTAVPVAAPVPTPAPKKKGNKLIVLLIVMLVALLGCIGAVCFLLRDKLFPAGKEVPAQLTEANSAAEQLYEEAQGVIDAMSEEGIAVEDGYYLVTESYEKPEEAPELPDSGSVSVSEPDYLFWQLSEEYEELEELEGFGLYVEDSEVVSVVVETYTYIGGYPNAVTFEEFEELELDEDALNYAAQEPASEDESGEGEEDEANGEETEGNEEDETSSEESTESDTEAETEEESQAETEEETAAEELIYTEAEDFAWTLEDGVLTLSGHGLMPEWDDCDDVPWCDYLDSITEVTIENGITNIGQYAFCGCENLAEIIISDTVMSIGRHAFLDCKSLAGVTLPNGMTSIGYGAFGRCNSLSEIVIPDSVTSIDGYAFSVTPWLDDRRNENPFVVVNDILIDGSRCEGDIIIPDDVAIIGEYAFADNINLTTVNISDSVKKISSSAFSCCIGLTMITIPDGVISIGTEAFTCCEGLTEITIPGSVTSIGYSFEGCTSLTDIYYTGTEEEWNAIDIQDDSEEFTSATIHFNS